VCSACGGLEGGRANGGFGEGGDGGGGEGSGEGGEGGDKSKVALAETPRPVL